MNIILPGVYRTNNGQYAVLLKQDETGQWVGHAAEGDITCWDKTGQCSDPAWNLCPLPTLDDITSDANPIPWRDFLQSRTELLAEANGVQWWCVTNCHYIIKDGYVYQRYGYHGQVLFNTLAHGKAIYDLSQWKEYSR